MALWNAVLLRLGLTGHGDSLKLYKFVGSSTRPLWRLSIANDKPEIRCTTTVHRTILAPHFGAPWSALSIHELL